MHFSVTKILLIIIFAIALALIIYILKPDSLPLFNQNKSTISSAEQNFDTPPINPDKDSTIDSLSIDYNKISVEKNNLKIDEDLLPSYNYSQDSGKTGKDLVINADDPLNDDNLSLSNLTKDVFNQPRLISIAQAYELYRNKVIFLDARNPEEFEEGHIAGAINLPYFSIDEHLTNIASIDKSEPIVTYCEGADCDMSIRLGNELFAKGYKKVFVFFGGWEEWEKADYPVVTS